MSTAITTRHTDIIVIGAGVLGTFHAYFAAQKGYKVFLLERNMMPSDASTRNFGMQIQTIVETTSEWANFVLTSREIYQALQREHDITFKQNGSLYLASTGIERQVLQEFARDYSDRYHCSFLEVDEVLRRYPFVHASYCVGALAFHEDCALEPRLLLKRVLSCVTQTEAVTYIPQTTVVDVTVLAQGCQVKDARGNVYTSDHVFVCSGAEYQTLFPEIFQRSGLKLCKLQMLRTVPQPYPILPHSILTGHSIKRYAAFTSSPSYPLLAQQPVATDIQQYGIHLLAKQAQDGSIILGDSHEYLSLDDVKIATTEYTDSRINASILRCAQDVLNLPTWDIQSMWNGYYLLHPELPIYTHTIDGAIHIVTGIGGKGMSTGPGFSRANIEHILH